MKKKRAKSFWKITMPKIRRYAREIAERFQPDKIILFGSQARGDTHFESDVDLMIIMETKDGLAQAVKIRWAIRAPFPVDLLVCSPKRWQRRLEDGESFIRELEENGKVLYANQDATVGQESRGRPQHRALPGRKQAAVA